MYARRLVCTACSGFLFLAARPVGAALLPGFVDEPIAVGFEQPTAVAFAPDGTLFVTEKAGRVWRVRDGRRGNRPFLDLSGEVNAVGDRGLTGIALDPEFAVTGRVYLLYNVDTIPGEPDEPRTAVFGRVTRYAAAGDTADPASRLVVLGKSAEDGIASCYGGHAVGTLRFAPDGALLVGAGDGANLDFVDVGQDVHSADLDCEARFGAAQDIGAFRAQSLGSLAGKVLRIDAATGAGLPDNPHFDGNPESTASRVFCRGFRNPFRFAVDPGSGLVWIGDVGVTSFEELDAARGGENFGWPCFEGPLPQPAYSADSLASVLCDAISPGAVTAPSLAWPHDVPGPGGFTGGAVTGVAVYVGTAYPEVFRGRVFVADLVKGWIRAVTVSDTRVTGVHEFADVRLPVDLVVDPVTQSLVYVSVGVGEVRRIRYTPANQAPRPQAAAFPAAGEPPLDVRFSSDGTYDPDGDPLRLRWTFGDGSSPTEAANPRHRYAEAGAYTAWLSAWDDSGHVDSAAVVIHTDGAPTVEILDPADGSRFTPDAPFALRAGASSPRGLGLAYDWRVDLIHNNHPHPGWFRSREREPVFVPAAHGADSDRYFYEIQVAVTDDSGSAARDTVRIFPEGDVLNHAPVARMALDRFTTEPGTVVRFDGSVSVDPDEDRLDYAWDFGDGFQATGANTSHFYAEPGIHRAALTVTDPGGARSEARATVAVEPPGALVRYDFEEGGGDIVSDEASGRNPAVLYGPVRVEDRFRGALAFDGRDDRGEGPRGLLSDLPAFTLAVWVLVDDRGLGAGFVGQPRAVALGMMNAQFLRVETGAGGTLTAYFGAGTGVWHHVAAVGDGTRLAMYVDGELLAARPRAAVTYGASDEPLRFGGGLILTEHARSLRGRLDRVRVYPRALTPDELRVLAVQPPTNAPPWAEAGPDTAAATTLPVGLFGAAGDDGLPVPGQLRFTWARVDGPGDAGFSHPHDLYTLALFARPGIYRLSLTADDGEFTASDTLRVSVTGRATGIGDAPPARAGIQAVSPNPFRNAATVTFVTDRPGPAGLRVFDLSGRVVRSFDLGAPDPGLHRVTWDGSDDAGGRVAAGIYFLELRVEGSRDVRKLALLR